MFSVLAHHEGRITTTAAPVGSCARPREVRVSPGQVLPAALVTQTEPDGHYPNNACQAWTIIAGDGQVTTIFLKTLVSRIPCEENTVLHLSQVAIKLNFCTDMFCVTESRISTIVIPEACVDTGYLQ